MIRIGLFVLIFPTLAFSQFNNELTPSSGCFDDNFTMEVGMSVYNPTITNCQDAILYLNDFGYGCETYLSEINNPFWGSNPNETIANICGCTCEDIVIEVLGCLDVNACNYNESATSEDGSCTYADSGYDCSGNCLNDIDNDGICDEFEIVGCTDNSACNFDELATDNNGSCIYADTGYDCQGECLADLDQDGICDGICDEFDYLVVDCECSFLDPVTYTVYFTNVDEQNCLIIEDCYCECINDFDNDGICDENEQEGCTDPAACNYDQSITPGGWNDGSCMFPGDDCISAFLEGGELIYGIYSEDCICIENNTFNKELSKNKRIIKHVLYRSNGL